jgi:hypothetical protein
MLAWYDLLRIRHYITFFNSSYLSSGVVLNYATYFTIFVLFYWYFWTILLMTHEIYFESMYTICMLYATDNVVRRIGIAFQWFHYVLAKQGYLFMVAYYVDVFAYRLSVRHSKSSINDRQLQRSPVNTLPHFYRLYYQLPSVSLFLMRVTSSQPVRWYMY